MPKRKHASRDSEPVKQARVDSREKTQAPEQRSASPPRPTVAPQVSGASTPRVRPRKGKPDTSTQNATATSSNTPRRREILHKLAPPRPFPTVPSSVAASGPKSAHKEGKNFICVTRQTPLAAYLNRCKTLFMKDGFRTVHLHAMGAAIPHLLTLSLSIPPLLPFARDEIKLEVRTGTIEVIDEIIPEDEDEDMSLRTREKGGVTVMIRVRECGDLDLDVQTAKRPGKRKEIFVVQEHGQDDDMDQDGGELVEPGEVET